MKKEQQSRAHLEAEVESWKASRDEVAGLHREACEENERLRGDYVVACETIAKMHAAAVGEVTGPIRGVVEDVEDVRATIARLEAELRDSILLGGKALDSMRREAQGQRTRAEHAERERDFAKMIGPTKGEMVVDRAAQQKKLETIRELRARITELENRSLTDVLEQMILETPTGPQRNALCDANIVIRAAAAPSGEGE